MNIEFPVKNMPDDDYVEYISSTASIYMVREYEKEKKIKKHPIGFAPPKEK